MMKSSRLYHMVLAGVLCAVGIVVPMFMPRIVLGTMSFTLASHVDVFLRMFISPRLLYTFPRPRDRQKSRMPSSA